MIPLIILIGLIATVAVLYNILVARKNDVNRTFGSIDVLLKKRYDLIPNLVETARQYMGYESRLLNEITELRSKAANNLLVSGEDRMKLESELGRKLFAVMAVAENYPDLKANQSFIMLQNSWKEIEDQLATARTLYNSSITRYNNAVEMFPTNLMATLMDCKPKALFESTPVEKENVKAGDLFG
jgi:LemA protein